MYIPACATKQLCIIHNVLVFVQVTYQLDKTFKCGDETFIVVDMDTLLGSFNQKNVVRIRITLIVPNLGKLVITTPVLEHSWSC